MTKITIPTNPDILDYLSMSTEDRHGVGIDRLRAEVAAADTRIEAAVRAALEAAATWVDNRASGYIDEHAIYDPSTGQTEFPGTGEEWLEDQSETSEAIRAIAADPAAVAGIVKLEDQHRRDAIEKGASDGNI